MHRLARLAGAAIILTLGILGCTYAETTNGRALITGVTILTTTIYALWYAYQEDLTMSDSPTSADRIRVSAARLISLGILSACEPDDQAHPRFYVVITSAGESVTVTRRDMPAMLRGLGLGHYAASAR